MRISSDDLRVIRHAAWVAILLWFALMFLLPSLLS